MKFQRHKNRRKWTTDRLSRFIIVSEVAAAAFIFAMFYLVGFDMPYDENPDFNAPLLTDVLIGFMALMLAAALAVCLVAFGRRYRKYFKDKAVNGIRPTRIAIGVIALLVVLLGATFLLGSGENMLINGKTYDNVFLLKLTDMFVNTSLLLLLATVLVAVWGTLRHIWPNKPND